MRMWRSRRRRFREDRRRARVVPLAEQAKILWEEAEANNLDLKVQETSWRKWDTCELCEQKHHGVVRCALGWACWKTYLGRPEDNNVRTWAMNSLGTGLYEAKHYEDALSMREAELSMLRRLGAPVHHVLVVQGNLANSYRALGRTEQALLLLREVYSGSLKLYGEEYEETLRAASNYAESLCNLKCFEEARSLLRKTIPVARRVLGEGHRLTLMMRLNYAKAHGWDPDATLDALRESVETLEETERTARRVLGGAHPTTVAIELFLDELREITKN